jgi:hypothetical protein
MSAENSRRLFSLLIGVFLLVILAAIVMPGRKVKVIAEPLPSPNGYDEFTAAAAMLKTPQMEVAQAASLGTNELREIVALAAPALARARGGFKMQCQAPITPNAGETQDEHIARMDVIPKLKQLAVQFAIEEILAEKELRYADAANSAMDLIQFGEGIGRGGVLFDEAISVSFMNLGIKPLLPLIDHLDTLQTHAALKRLSQLQSQWYPLDQAIKTERLSIEKQLGQYNLISRTILRREANKSISQVELKTAKKRLTTKQALQQVILQLARRAYELDKGKKPASDGDLIPEYMNTPPKDAPKR